MTSPTDTQELVERLAERLKLKYITSTKDGPEQSVPLDLMHEILALIVSLQKQLAERTAERDARPTTIAVEKALLLKLGREWTPDKISINSLIDELAGRALAAEARADTLARRVGGLEAALRAMLSNPDKKSREQARAALTGERP